MMESAPAAAAMDAPALHLLADVAIAQDKAEKAAAALDTEILSLRCTAAAKLLRESRILDKFKKSLKNQDFLKLAASVMPWAPLPGKRKRETPYSPEPINCEEEEKQAEKKKKLIIKIKTPPTTNNHNSRKQSPKQRISNCCIPEEFKNKIRELAGPDALVSEERLLIQKALTASDVKVNQSRLSMPVRSMVEREFLREEEEWVLRQRVGDGVTLIDPSLKRCSVSLRQWVMRKGSGRRSSVSYVLTKRWKEIFKRLRLKEGMTVQVWSFRVNEELWLALVRL